MDTLWTDLRQATRSFLRTPTFTLIAIVSLAAGIGINTAAFSAIDAILLQPYPGVVDQDRLLDVRVGARDALPVGRYATADEVDHLRRNVSSFSSLAASARIAIVIGTGDVPSPGIADVVTANFFRTLETVPAHGRFFGVEDDRQGARQNVVISDGLWRRDFAGRSDVVGKSMVIGGASFTIIGVTPPEFFGIQPGEFLNPSNGAPDVYIAIGAASGTLAVRDASFRMTGRLAPGVDRARAETEANLVMSRLAESDPANHRGAFAALGDTRIHSPGEAIGGALLIMLVPVLVLLVTCANLANQMLVRGIERSREIAVRLSLGASRGRLIRQLLTESAVLSGLGATGGVALSVVLVRVMRVEPIAFPIPIRLDVLTLSFTVALAILCVLLVALVPALRATRFDLASSLRSGSSDTTVGRSRLRSALVIAQVAISLTLLVITSLFTRASAHATDSRTTRGAGQLYTIPIDAALIGLDSVGGRALQHRLAERLRAVPGVSAVGRAPFGVLESAPEQRISLAGGHTPPRSWLDVGEVDGDWFAATGTPITRGRSFDDSERRGQPRVSIVDETAAAALWPGQNPLGQTLRIGDGDSVLVTTVVGVVPERRVQLDQPADGMAFIPGDARYHDQTTFIVRATAVGAARQADAAMMGALRQAVLDVEPRLPAPEVRTFAMELGRQTAPLRMLATGLGALGTIAIALAALGLYAVLSFIVARRRHEIGVRIALGAQSSHVVAMVIRQAAGLAGTGIGIGAACAAAVAVIARSLLFGLAPLDPIAFIGAAALFVAVMLAASAVPARRATRVSPMDAMRE